MVSLPAAAPRRLSRVEAFAQQGVTLAYPPRSWSGVREEDGAIVFAMPEGEVRCGMDGFRCLLWSPLAEEAADCVDRPIRVERLHHCRLAYFFGGADGLLVSGAEVVRGSVITLRVEKQDEEYWAYWGLAVRSPDMPADAASVERGEGSRMAA